MRAASAALDSLGTDANRLGDVPQVHDIVVLLIDLAAMATTRRAAQLVAALFFGWFAERFGRMPAIIWSTLIYSVMSLACAFAWDFNSFLVGALVVPHVGWQWLFVIGAFPALVVVLMRRMLPESPRWLATRGRHAEADAVVSMIERAVERSTGPLPTVRPVIKAHGRAASLADLFGSEHLGRSLTHPRLY